MNKKISMAIGNRIQMRRRALNMTMEAIAEIIGISQPQFSRYESGERRIPAEYLFRIALILSTPIEWFYIDCSLSLSDLEQTKPIKDEDEDESFILNIIPTQKR